MTRLTGLLLLVVFAVSSPVYAKDKDSSLEKAIKEEFGVDKDPGKGQGRPDNPGEHGRDNAAEKQSRGQGKGSKQEDSWEDRIRDEIEGDGKDKKKDKAKKNKK